MKKIIIVAVAVLSTGVLSTSCTKQYSVKPEAGNSVSLLSDRKDIGSAD